MCVLVWEGESKVERSEEDLGNKRTVSGVCRGAEATHECLRQPLTRTQTRHTYTHSTLSIIHISLWVDADSTRVKLQRSTHRWVAVYTKTHTQRGCSYSSLFYLLHHCSFFYSHSLEQDTFNVSDWNRWLNISKLSNTTTGLKYLVVRWLWKHKHQETLTRKLRPLSNI